jgi:hypothetical protein
LETVTILRSLWRYRLAVGAVALIAILIGWMVAYRLSLPPERRAYSVGIASASILVDTPKSQVVEVDPEGSDTIAARASVLSNLMVDGEIKGIIAKHSRLPADKIVASTQAAAAADPPPLDAESLALTTSLATTSDMSDLPIIRVQTQAPDVRRAIELANASVAALGEYLDSKAVDETVPDARRLRVRALGTAQGHTAMRGPSRVLAIVVALLVLVAGCALILITSALARAWRTAAAFDKDGRGAIAFTFDPPVESDERVTQDVNGSVETVETPEPPEPRGARTQHPKSRGQQGDRKQKQPSRPTQRPTRAAKTAAASRTPGS